VVEIGHDDLEAWCCGKPQEDHILIPLSSGDIQKKYAIELVGFIVWVQRDDAMVMNHDYKNWTPNRINRWTFPLASGET
jgi:hypothetical protein